MNKKQQELFVSFFEQIFEAEEAFQDIKKEIRLQQNCNLVALFDVISLGDDSISIVRLRQFLRDRVACNQRELYQLFQKLDISRQGSISRADFIRELTPITQDSQQNQQMTGKLNPKVEGLFIKLIIEYLNRFRIIQVARKEIHFIQPYDAFAEIDNFKTGIIGLGELQRFMSKNDYNMTQYQQMLLLHGLRRRCYLQINLQVFCENLDPLQFGQYQQYRASIDSEKQRQFLNRSRKQEEAMRRSRIESKKIQHSIAKQQRRKRAELQRQLQIQQRINNQIQQQQKQKQRYIRRAMLEQDKNIRWNIQTGNQALQRQKQRLLLQKSRNEELRYIKDEQNAIQNVLANTALRREDQIQRSRRLRYNIQREREIQEDLQHKRQLQLNIQRQNALIAQLQIKREQERRKILREKNLAGQYDREARYRRNYFIPEVQASRKIYQQELRLERQRAQREYQLQRMRVIQSPNVRPYQTIMNSRRIEDLERELEKTRMEIRQRQSRYNLAQSKKQPETADREYRTDRDYKAYRG